MVPCKTIAILVLLALIQNVRNEPVEEADIVHVADVKTRAGTFRGVISSEPSNKGRQYVSFLGIPYAKPPVGKLRFEDPQPIDESFKDIFTADTPTRCIQVMHSLEPVPEVQGVEDCLHLNIHVPENVLRLPQPYKERRPVIVHIHGGGFMFGCGHEVGPKYIMDADVIFVTFNYRVGILGFLAGEDPIVTGNYGLRDQIIALKWIRRNIAAFGGDPRKVTLHGFSAGGASVHFHMMSPPSKGLFHRAVSQSGVALNPWALQDNPMRKFTDLLQQVDCFSPKNFGTKQWLRDMKTCLQTVPVEKLVERTNYFRSWYFNPFSPFAPVIDDWAGENAIIPVNPYAALANKSLSNDVPWMVSVTAEDGLYPGADFARDDYKLFHELDEQWADVLSYLMHYNDVSIVEAWPMASELIRQQYFKVKAGGEYPKLVPEKDFPKVIQMLTDRLYHADFNKAIRMHGGTASSKPHVWAYMYNYTADDVHSLAFLHTQNQERHGVGHGDDVVMIMDLPASLQKEAKRSEQDKKMAELLLQNLVTFASEGKPSIHGWEPTTLDDPIKFLEIKSPKQTVMHDSHGIGLPILWRLLMFHENDLYSMGKFRKEEKQKAKKKSAKKEEVPRVTEIEEIIAEVEEDESPAHQSKDEL